MLAIALTVAGVLPAPAQTTAANSLPTVLSPYLQNPSADGMTICFLAQGTEQVRVAWKREGGWLGLKEVAPKSTAITGTPWTMWKTRLTGLRPGATYQYEVRYRLAGRTETTPIYHFRTLNPRAKTLRFVAFNDLHNRDQTLAALMRHVKPDDYEFTVLLGDCWADPSAANGAHQVFRTLQAYIQLLDAASKPFFLVRGNHETRGNFASKLAMLFDLPDLDSTQKWGEDQWQFAMRAGPVWFLAMDTGEDDDLKTPENSYKRPKFWQACRQREAEWLKKIVTAESRRHAAWRVFLSHIPLYNNNQWFSETSQQYWEPILHAVGLDLTLAGHDHQGKFLPKKDGGQPPWPVLIGGGPSLSEGTVMLIAADATTLRARLLAATDGRQLTEFNIAK